MSIRAHLRCETKACTTSKITIMGNKVLQMFEKLCVRSEEKNVHWTAKDTIYTKLALMP